MLLSVFLASIGILNAFGFARTEGWQSAFAWGTMLFWSLYIVVMTLRAFEQCTVRPQPKTKLTFDETGFSLERAGLEARARHVACTRVRSVRSTSETIGIYGAWGPYSIIPKSALPDEGAQLMRFFADRIVTQGLSESRSGGVTIIDNSVTPLFAS